MTNFYNKTQMLHLFAAWKIVQGTPSLPERKGAQPVYLKLDAPTLNLVKIENVGKGLFQVKMVTEAN
jgi:hypothetical protein